MKKHIFLILFSFIFALFSAQNPRPFKTGSPSSATMKAGAFIDVNAAGYPESSYNIQQLVTDVLVSGGSNCSANVTNVIVSPNLAASDVNRSWGYFNRGTTNFPFASGIHLNTGYARQAGNSYLAANQGATIGTMSDPDLATALNIAPGQLRDAAYIQFDFVPVTSQISFQYIFASEEYESDYPCTFTDAFALLIKRVTDPAYTNIAVLPGGAGPVSVTNIHPAIPGSCGAVNEQYFGGYNTTNIETNYSGRTVPLTATATVIPGETYRFKIVLADYTDGNYDSGVFLLAGSFNIGVQLTDTTGNPLPSDVTICSGQSITLNATVQATNATYQWSLNGTPIAGATASTYTATQAGTYTVSVLIPGSTCPGTANINVTVTQTPVVQNAALTACSAAPTAVFDLTSAQPNISVTPGATFTYYTNLADANAGNNNFIAGPAAYTSGNAVIYVRVKNGECAVVAELQLTVNPVPAAPVITGNTALCDGGTTTLTSSYATGNLWSTGATTQTITVTTPGTYTVTHTALGCTSPAATVTVTAAANPNLQITGNIAFCQGGSTTLTATTTGTGHTYLWSNGATTPAITVNTAGTYTVTVTTAENCTFTQTVTVTADTPPTAQNATLSECSTALTAPFNLTAAQPAISTTPGVTFSYYLNAADANAGNANTIPTPTNHISGTGIVYVRVTSGTCAVVVQLQLTVSQTVTPTITPSSTVICGTGSVTLTSNFATGNTWSTGATTQTITVTTPGTYTLTNSNGNCTGAPASITITQDADPNLQISGNNFYCTGSSTVLTASGTGTLTYLWSNGTTGATTTVNSAGTYTVTATTPGGCQFTQSVTITENPVPAGQNASLSECSNGTTATFDLTSAQPAISTTPGVTFTYYTTLADANAGNTNNITTPATYSSTTAIIYVRISNGNCFRVVELQLTVVPIPAPVITQSAPALCGNATVTLTSNYPTGNTWSTGATTQSITVSTAGTYTLTVANGNCVSAPVSVTITHDPDPNVQITGQTVFCSGGFTTLTATATGTGLTYSWSNGSTTNQITVNTAGTYTVTVTAPGGCQFTESVTVTTEPSPLVVMSPPGQINCTNPTQTIDASGSTYQPGATFQWTVGGGGNIVSGANTLTPVVDQGGTYTLTITNPGGLQCSAQASVLIVKDVTPPTITLTSGTTTICAGSPAILVANGAATYMWNGLPGTGNTQTVTPMTTTTYEVTGVGANGCPGNTATITINVVPAIVSTLTDVQFCEGDSAVLDAGSGPNYTYLWSTGATTQTITVNTAGTYTVTIDNGICTKTFTSVATYTPVPVVTEVKYENNSITIITDQPPSQPLEYSLDSGITWQSSPTFFNIIPNATYTIWVRVPGVNCYGSIEYFTFTVKNVITPNDDGYNDYVDFTGVSNYKNFGGGIYDRYGKEVFRLDSKNAIWKGYYQQFKVPTGTYWYKISWTDPLSNQPILRTGWIMVKNRD